MGGYGSGGANKLTLADHRLAGTVRKDCHVRTPAAMPEAPVSNPDRRRLLHGLDRGGAPIGRLACSTSLPTGTRAACTRSASTLVSCRRLAAIVDDSERRREMRTNLALLKALELER